MTITMQAQQRTNTTKGKLHQLRKGGKVPGIVYGKGLQASSVIALDEKEVLHLLRSHPNAVIDLQIPDSGRQPVMITHVQRDSLSRKLMHVDLHQINMNEQIKAHVRIEVTGDSAGVREGGVLSVSLHEIEIQCLPGDIPEAIEADISSLAIGENVTVGDLKLPDKVQVLTDAGQTVAAVLAPQKEISAEEAEQQKEEDFKGAARAEDANSVDEQ